MMPTAAPKVCCCQPCPNPAEYRGRCPQHAKLAERARGTASERGYDGDWRRLVAVVLMEEPFCQIRTHCMGATATEGDHIISIVQRPDLRLVRSNIQSTCKTCHSAKTRREQQ
jgi:5-methylcytosine-specific restriction protein A